MWVGCNECLNHTHNEQINLWNQTSNIWMLNEWENLRVLFFLKLIIFEPPSYPLEGRALRGLDSEDLRLAAEGRECAE